MKTTIINQLNAIRFLEHRKLYEKFDLILGSNKKREAIRVPYDMIEQISRRHKEAYSEKNYFTAISNYNKLRDILLFTINARKRMKFDLLALSKENAKVEELIEKMNKQLLDLILKINSSVPEQISMKPLAPFFFLHQDIKTIKGKIGIIILSNNNEEHLPQLFDSFLKNNTYENYKFFIIDRNSSDQSVKIINSYKDRINIKLITKDQEFTSSYLNNLAVDTCRSEYLLFLHPKALIQQDMLPEFIRLFNDHNCGIIGASIRISGNPAPHDNSRLYGRLKFKLEDMAGLPDIPNPIIDPEFLVESGINLTIKGFRNEERTFIPPGYSLPCLKPFPAPHQQSTGVETVPAVPGFAMFCKREDFIKVEGFDLNYFNGFEYNDLCLKFAGVINKNALLAHDIEVGLNTDNIIDDWCIQDPVIEFHNLGTLINRHGYFIRHHYLTGLAEGSNKWTDDTPESLLDKEKLISGLTKSLFPGEHIMSDPDRIKEIVHDYLLGTKENKFRIAIKIPALDNENAKLWGDYHFAHSLKNAFLRKGHYARVDLLDHWYENGYMNDDVVIVLRGLKNYHVRTSQINLMWNISHPQHVVWDEYTDYDHVFVASDIFPAELLEKYNIQAEALLQCTDANLFQPVEIPAQHPDKTDILYVANSRGELRKSVDYAMRKKIPLTIFGTNWENILPAGMVKGNFIPNEDLKTYYSGCSILLNDHWKDMADKGYISNRVFDALACGAVVLTDRVAGLDRIFGSGIFYYGSPEEMEEQIRWIRENYEEAKALAMKNSSEVMEKHTFDQRAGRILEVIMQIHERKTAAAPPEAEKKPGFFERILEYAGKRF